MTQDVVATEHNVITPVSVDANGDVVVDDSGNSVTPVLLKNLSTTLGEYVPARDVFTQWAFGQDDTFQTLVVSTLTTGLAMDARHINTNARSILIIAGGATNFDWALRGTRNSIDAESVAISSAAAVTTVSTLIDIPASDGYLPYLWLDLTNNSGNLTYKAVLLGKGG